MKITFHGAAQEVTGSCYRVETPEASFLVDCGMFQGGREARERNRRPFPFAVRDIDFVLLTHAHIDHSGLLPKLVKEGYRGPVYATHATADLLGVMLPDSGHIQETEAEWAGRRKQRGRARHDEGVPLYTVSDAERCLDHLRTAAYDEVVKAHPSVDVRFRDAGHILGSAIIEVAISDSNRKRTVIVFSGDLGQPGRPILRDPASIEAADYLIMESTYGDRLHKDPAATREEFIHAVNDTLYRKGGNVIIPAFAVGRTQEIIYYFHQLTCQGHFHDLNLFVDSPMAAEVTRITTSHLEIFDAEAKALAAWRNQASRLPRLVFTGSVEESRGLNTIRGGAVIISASGMCDAGRIKHHLLHNLGRKENTILITGFQAQGTLGRRLVDGADRVRIFDQEVPVRAEVYTLGGLSAHADRKALIDWLHGFRRPPARTFVVHGEQKAAAVLAERIESELDWPVTVPAPGATEILGARPVSAYESAL